MNWADWVAGLSQPPTYERWENMSYVEVYAGLGKAQRAVLAEVAQRWEDTNVSDIAQATGYDKFRVRAILSGLQKRGLVNVCGNIVSYSAGSFNGGRRGQQLV
jgi:hypothetical protein